MIPEMFQGIPYDKTSLRITFGDLFEIDDVKTPGRIFPCHSGKNTKRKDTSQPNFVGSFLRISLRLGRIRLL